MSLEVLAAEVMTFESFYECIGGQSLQFNGEAVPGRWAQHSKVLLSDRSPCMWHDECPAVC